MIKKKRQYVVFGIITLILSFLVFRTRMIWLEILSVLGLAVFFALILSPVCTQLEKRGLRRNIASFSSILILVMTLIIFLMIFVPYLLTHTVSFIKRITPTVSDLFDRAQALMFLIGYRREMEVSFPQLITSLMTPLTAGIAKGSAAIVSAAGTLIMAIVIAYYLITVRKEAGCHVLLCIPIYYRNTFISALRSCRNAVLGYLSGLIKTCIFVASATFAGLLFLGFKDAAILAVFMGLLEVIPYVGPFLGMIPILLSAIPLGSVRTILSVVLVIVIQQIESGVIGPYFTASSTSIHPLAAIISVFIGGSFFGLAGVVFAVPLLIIARNALWSLKAASIPD